jgi:hypothetical protein
MLYNVGMPRASEKELLYYRKAFHQLKSQGHYPSDMEYGDLSKVEKERVRQKGRVLLLHDRLV